MDEVFWQVGMTLAESEKRIILRCLRFNEGHMRKTAAMLDVSARTISNKLKEYGVTSIDSIPEEETQSPVKKKK